MKTSWECEEYNGKVLKYEFLLITHPKLIEHLIIKMEKLIKFEIFKNGFWDELLLGCVLMLKNDETYV